MPGSGAFTVFIAAVIAASTQGALDASFGNNGVLTIPAPGARIVATRVTQDDARVITAANRKSATFHVANREGGWRIRSTPLPIQHLCHAVFSADGGFYASYDKDPVEWRDCLPSHLARFKADGALDTGFGEGGSVATPFRDIDDLSMMAMDGAGRIVIMVYHRFVAAQARKFSADAPADSSGARPAQAGACGREIVRFLPDGRVDPSLCWSTDPQATQYGSRIAHVLSDGRIVVTQNAFSKSGWSSMSISLHSDTGALIGSASLCVTPPGGKCWASVKYDALSVLPRPNGGVLLASRYGRMWFTPEFRLDTTQGNNGAYLAETFDPNPGAEFAPFVAFPDGHFFLVDRKHCVTKHAADGTPDTRYGTVCTGMNDLADPTFLYFRSALLTPAGDVIVVGGKGDSPAIARVLGREGR